MKHESKLDLGRAVDTGLTREIVLAEIDVHRHLGPGLIESAYRSCLVHELGIRSLRARTEVQIPVTYKHVVFPSIPRGHLKLTGIRVGFLMNFNVSRLVLGLRRFVR